MEGYWSEIIAGAVTVILGVIAYYQKARYDAAKDLLKEVSEAYQDNTITPEEWKKIMKEVNDFIHGLED
jgi:hypothetical protein